MMSDNDRITQLENEVAALRGRLRGAGLLPPVCDLPNDDQVEQLLALIEKTWPILRPKGDADYRRKFASALHVTSFMWRTKEFSRYAVLTHLDEASAWLRRFELGAIDLRSLYAAAICNGIGYRAPTENFCDFELAISLGIGSTPVMRWRETL